MRLHRSRVPPTIAGHAVLIAALSALPIKWREHNTLCHRMSAVCG